MTYRSAMGKTVDMDKLRQQNETVRAVGNMNVNARGDILDSHNNVINDSSHRVNKMYQNVMMNGGRTPIRHRAPDQQMTQPTIEPDLQPVVEPPVVADEPEYLQEELEFDLDMEEPVGKPVVPVVSEQPANKSSKKA